MKVINWLLKGDPSIAFLTHRDLLMSNLKVLNEQQTKMFHEGHVRKLLDCVDPITGLWGGGVYSPKYYSTHYTLLLLWNLGIDPSHPSYQRGMSILLNHLWPSQGMTRKNHYQDMCVSAMVLTLNIYGGSQDPALQEIADYILDHQFSDGGWNCAWQHKPQPTKSSLHTTLSVLETILTMKMCRYAYRHDEFEKAIGFAVEFILKKRLFRSVSTGEIIHEDMIKWRFPSHWRYSIIRALDTFQALKIPYDSRMQEAIDYLVNHADKGGRLPALAPFPGYYHFRLESTRGMSYFNTLRLWRIAKAYAPDLYQSWNKQNV